MSGTFRMTVCQYLPGAAPKDDTEMRWIRRPFFVYWNLETLKVFYKIGTHNEMLQLITNVSGHVLQSLPIDP